MSSDVPIEKKFRILVEITRASHFAWREAAIKCCPGVDPGELVNEMWEITGVRTAEAYLKHLDPAGDLVGQVAESIVWSSQCMGEEVLARAGWCAGRVLRQAPGLSVAPMARESRTASRGPPGMRPLVPGDDSDDQRKARDEAAVRDALRPPRRRRLLPAEDLARGVGSG